MIDTQVQHRSNVTGRGGARDRARSPHAGHVVPLDGVRAVAVALVLLFHLEVPGFRGGFVGVDIFFVLSGFLITSLLLREHEETGGISLRRFWGRRIRRLMPALALLLMGIMLWAGLTATTAERQDVRADLLTTLGYVSNWHLISTSDYFSSSGIESPLQHTWSLAVEEQFYLAWPAIVVLCLRGGRRSTRVALAASAIGVLSLFLLAWHWEPGSVERSYMGTDSRIFQPLIGALGAVLVSRRSLRGVLRSAGGIFGWIGVLGLVLGAVWIGNSADWYFQGGAIAIAVASLLIIAPLWAGGAISLGSLLSLRPLVWLGVVSYGVYLWHWPMALLSGVREATGAEHAVRASIAVTFTIALAALSYRFVELPILRRPLPHPASERLGPDGTVAGRRRRLGWLIPVLGLIGFACTSVVVTSTPSPSAGTPVVLFVGDSVPLHLQPHLERAAEDLGWRAVTAAHGACPVSGEAPADPGGQAMRSSGGCASEVIPHQDQQLAAADPDVVVWWDRFSIAGFIGSDGRYVPPASRRFWQVREATLDRSVQRLSSGGARVLLVAVEPPGTLVAERITTGCANCDWWIPFQVEHYHDVTAEWNDLLRRYAAEHPDVASFVSITDVVCRDDAVPCDDTFRGSPARVDGTHYGQQAGRLVAATLMRDVQALSPPVSGSVPVAAPGDYALGASDWEHETSGATGTTLLLTGDSVPRDLTRRLTDRLGDRLGWRVVSATQAACAVTGESIAWADGSPRGDPDRCHELTDTQDAMLAAEDPDIVLWWDRFSIAHFITADDGFVRSGSPRFWDLRSAALDAAVTRFAAGGATVVFLATEPIGERFVSRCSGSVRARYNCQTWLRFQVRHFEDIIQPWNRTMRTYARDHPGLAEWIRISDEICRRIEAPCDDRIRGVHARPDGTHYDGLGEHVATRSIVRELRHGLLTAIGQPS